jgi:hypothetical protein
MKLDPQKLQDVFLSCLAETDDKCSVIVEGISAKFGFNDAQLKNNSDMIRAMLDELPVEFKGGWSFLNACDDKHGRQWTGEHKSMEQLFVLGMAMGMVSELMPREDWKDLPGGMPYYQVK